MESGAKSEANQYEEGSGAVGSSGGGGKVYHERQRMQFCLLHALNNLMQEKEAFNRAELDGIAENLVLADPNKDKWTPLSLIFKPHHNALTGNYDVNVLIAALGTRKTKVVWHDHRKGASSIDLDAVALVGLIINVPVRRLRGLCTGRHWVAIRSIDGIWFNLDSDYSSPKQFQGKEKLMELLDSILSQGGELMIVLRDRIIVLLQISTGKAPPPRLAILCSPYFCIGNHEITCICNGTSLKNCNLVSKNHRQGL